MENQIINEFEACNYVKCALQNIGLWDNITYKKNEESNVWVFSGYIEYKNKPHKIIKVVGTSLFIKLLKIGFEVKKGIPVNYVDLINRETLKFKIKYSLIDPYCRKRKR
ncbi:MAG: hypothetical protein E7163_00970 [Firmicutes bacterium]|nr:hypothetical protein [Bacillota bacterium]